jgi:hypothetical protein
MTAVRPVARAKALVAARSGDPPDDRSRGAITRELVWPLNGGNIIELHRDQAIIETERGARRLASAMGNGRASAQKRSRTSSVRSNRPCASARRARGNTLVPLTVHHPAYVFRPWMTGA